MPPKKKQRSAVRKFRHWCFTNYKLDFDYAKLIESKQVKYLAYGEEKCPTTDRVHHQGWMSFVNQQSDVKKVAELLGKCHVEGIMGTLVQNDVYCSKAASLKEFGEKPSQGARTDLAELRDRIVSGVSIREIGMENPNIIHQYGRTLNWIQSMVLRGKWRTEMTKGIWYWGPTGAG